MPAKNSAPKIVLGDSDQFPLVLPSPRATSLLGGTFVVDLSLVYDLMESWRVLAVDSVITPFFTRRHKQIIEKDSHTFRKILVKLASRYQEKFPYHDRCESLVRIINFEAISLREAIISKLTWRPYEYRWGHRHHCQQKTTPKMKVV